MTSAADSLVQTRRFYAVPPGMIRKKDGFNPRFDFGDLEALKKSILAHGVIQPLRVRRKSTGYELVDGERRYTAVMELLSEKKLGAEFRVPVILEAQTIPDVQALIHMFEANTGKAFAPLEEAAAFKRMRDAGMTIKDICKSVGRSDSHVIDTLKLLEASDEVKAAVAEKKITKGEAVEAAKAPKEEQPAAVAKAINRRVAKKEEPKKRSLAEMMKDLENALIELGEVQLKDRAYWFNSDMELRKAFTPALLDSEDGLDKIMLGAFLMYQYLQGA